ncbi:12181_t:CDS:1, partial [Funneliformis mosseae]
QPLLGHLIIPQGQLSFIIYNVSESQSGQQLPLLGYQLPSPMHHISQLLR